MSTDPEDIRIADDIDALLAGDADANDTRRGVRSAEAAVWAEAFEELREAYDRVDLPQLADRREVGQGRRGSGLRMIRSRASWFVGAGVAAAALISIVVWTLEPRGEHTARVVGSDQINDASAADGSVDVRSTASDSQWSGSDEPVLTTIQSPRLLLFPDLKRETGDATNVAKPRHWWSTAGGARLTSSRPPSFLLRGGATADWPAKSKVPRLILKRRSRTHVHDAHDRSDRRDPVGQSHVTTSRFG